MLSVYRHPRVGVICFLFCGLAATSEWPVPNSFVGMAAVGQVSARSDLFEENEAASIGLPGSPASVTELMERHRVAGTPRPSLPVGRSPAILDLSDSVQHPEDGSSNDASAHHSSAGSSRSAPMSPPMARSPTVDRSVQLDSSIGHPSDGEKLQSTSTPFQQQMEPQLRSRNRPPSSRPHCRDGEILVEGSCAQIGEDSLFDYIVVGCGAVGCPLARTLADSGKCSESPGGDKAPS